jgi:hypothetical protein
MTPEDRERLIEQAVTAHRERDGHGRVVESPAFYDLDDEGRRALFDETSRARAIEAAIDADGQSSTAKAILGRIRGDRA